MSKQIAVRLLDDRARRRTPTSRRSPSSPSSSTMRPIQVARLDKARPVLVLTRDTVRPHLTTVTFDPD